MPARKKSPTKRAPQALTSTGLRRLATYLEENGKALFDAHTVRGRWPTHLDLCDRAAKRQVAYCTTTAARLRALADRLDYLPAAAAPRKSS